MKQIDKDLLIRRIGLIAYDIIAVVISSYLALLVRFDFSVSQIPDRYEMRVLETLPLGILATLAVFVFFRLYSSLWTYAGAMEMVNIGGAGIVSGFANMIIIMVNYRTEAVPLPRSYYVIYTVAIVGLTFISRYMYRGARAIMRRRVDDRAKRRVLIIGAGDAGDALCVYSFLRRT